MADTGGSGAQPESDIFTVLVIIAAVFLLAGTIYVSVRAQALFGAWLPFSF